MRKLILLLLFPIIGHTQTVAPCSYMGDSKSKRLQLADIAKNRTTAGTKNLEVVELKDVLAPGNDTARYNQEKYVQITGYVYDVKWGSAETCNCHATDKSQMDIHIEIVIDLKDASNAKAMVCEINRFSRSTAGLDMDIVRKLKGKKVTLTGLMFFDSEHKQNAVNTRPDGTNLWRATCWELHPCLSIKETK